MSGSRPSRGGFTMLGREGPAGPGQAQEQRVEVADSENGGLAVVEPHGMKDDQDTEKGQVDPSVRQLFTQDTADAYEADKENHYVLIIHGTFDAPPTGFVPVPWYWLDPDNPHNFAGTLAKDLAKSPLSTDAVWKTLPEGVKLRDEIHYPFYWSGNNTHESRVQAGKDLAVLINRIGKADARARVHLVAHSHGGNVVLKALSSYLTLLRKECNKTYNDAITNAFWEHNAEGYKAIKEYQSVHTESILLRLLGPFAVVKRTWNADPNLGPFPWGSWDLTDKLLGLGKSRQAKYLRKKWATCSNTNCLGRIVFMGTPFYSKFWEPQAWVSMLMNILIMSCVVLAVVVGATIALLLLVTHDGDSANLTSWDATYWWAAGFGSLGLVLYNTLSSKRYFDGNIYFTEKKAWSPAMRALVLNAGKLDEAALALSTEPLVRAYLVPQLRSFLAPDPWRSLKAFPAKTCMQSCSHLYNNVWVILWNLIFCVPYLLLRASNVILVPFFSNQLLKLFITLGFGLQSGELEYARVYVEEYLRLPPATHSIIHWNVQKIITAAALDAIEDLKRRAVFEEEAAVTTEALEETKAGAEDPRSVAQRWRFLWDDELLEQKASECQTLQLLRDQSRSMQHNPKITRGAFERELKLICVTLEERYKDMTGNVELSHGSYFRNKAIIGAISYFLIHGYLPSWAPELGEVLEHKDLGAGPNESPATGTAN